ncbi:Panacea domain-containing protein [Chitinophaga rhizophila]|uniref:DUF4065 domain-containing protein n=1 Tax=Chitinophaga rhizophila TaxID=2866212 RepID=A0ABS7GA68_9BACT|nr:type II toxin-antitoxin system antitoxin SocA domain-containing protein [Chitinophaga rhizophila]MBW8684552.1 DUF4065 domain-containing protein [Chitinophaga rhizophila]
MSSGTIYNANEVADWFITRLNTDAGDTMSPLKLQKLIYYAQAWHLTIFKQPLFQEKIEAWVHGPAVATVYQRFKSTSKDAAIDWKVPVSNVEFPIETQHLLEEVYSIYGEHSAGFLEELTHSEPPWIKARKGLDVYEKSNREITHESMISYYSSINHD